MPDESHNLREKPIRSNPFAGLLAAVCISLVGCSTRPPLVFHSFQFDATTDSPEMEILGWRYGSSRHPGAQLCPDASSDCPAVGQYVIVTGSMRTGEDIYVRWRNRLTNEQFQKTVRLKDSLPENIEKSILWFLVNGQELYVYLIMPDRIQPNPCPSEKRRKDLMNTTNPDDKMLSRFCSRIINRLSPDKALINPVQQ